MSLLLSAIVLVFAPMLSALPDEPLWSLVFAAFLTFGSAYQMVLRARSQTGFSKQDIAIIVLTGCADLSLLVHWLVLDLAKPTYLDIMLRGAIFWAASAAAFLLSSNDRSRTGLYVRAIAILIGASWAGAFGLQDYLIHWRNGEGQWREFGTSTPDFFAGYLVMTLPIALGLFIGSKGGKGRIFWVFYVLGLIVQLGAIPTTGSRFAFVSLAVGIATFLLTSAVSKSRGMIFGSVSRKRLYTLVAIAAVGAIIVAKPIISRLNSSAIKSQQNSGDFRLWTWRGTVKLISSDPVFGAGPGMFSIAYLKDAIVGYTTHAHDSYLQTAADIGVPALLVLLVAFGLSVKSGLNAVDEPLELPAYVEFDPEPRPEQQSEQEEQKEIDTFLSDDIVREPNKILISLGETIKSLWELGREALDQVLLIDDRYLVCGLIAGVAAAFVQNIVDSDWYTFADGITLFTILGMLCSIAPMEPKRRDMKKFKSLVAVTLVLTTIVAGYLSIAELQHWTSDYTGAMQTDPLSGRYADDAAMKAFLPANDLNDTENALELSCTLAPSGLEYHKLGSLFFDERDYSRAESDWLIGLQYDPHSIQNLISLAKLYQQLGRPSDALRYYRTISDLETTPYGTVRAIPDIVETRFIDAGSYVGDYYLAGHQPSRAIPYYLRVKKDCEEYASLGGASNGERIAISQGVVDTALDQSVQKQYSDVLTNLASAYADEGQTDKADAVRRESAADLQTFSEQIAPRKG